MVTPIGPDGAIEGAYGFHMVLILGPGGRYEDLGEGGFATLDAAIEAMNTQQAEYERASKRQPEAEKETAGAAKCFSWQARPSLCNLNQRIRIMTTEPSKVKPAFDQGVTATPAADFITILTSADGKVLTKWHTPAGMIDFDGGKWFTSREVPIGSLADLAAALECPSDSCVILGRSSQVWTQATATGGCCTRRRMIGTPPTVLTTPRSTTTFCWTWTRSRRAVQTGSPIQNTC